MLLICSPARRKFQVLSRAILFFLNNIGQNLKQHLSFQFLICSRVNIYALKNSESMFFYILTENEHSKIKSCRLKQTNILIVQIARREAEKHILHVNASSPFLSIQIIIFLVAHAASFSFGLKPLRLYYRLTLFIVYLFSWSLKLYQHPQISSLLLFISLVCVGNCMLMIDN